MPDRRDPAQYASDGTALLLTAAVAAMLVASSRTVLDNLTARAARSDSPIELTVQLAQPEAPPAPPPPLPPRAKTHRTQPAPTAPPDPLPVESQPAPADGAAVLAYSPPPAPAPAQPHADLEAQYAAQLKADIERRHHAPESAQYRLRRPSGEVRIEFAVLRSGEPRSATMLRSSGSAILDEAALQLVSTGHYPPMPDKCFVGETQHSFVITVEYRAADLVARP